MNNDVVTTSNFDLFLCMANIRIVSVTNYDCSDGILHVLSAVTTVMAGIQCHNNYAWWIIITELMLSIQSYNCRAYYIQYSIYVML